MQISCYAVPGSVGGDVAASNLRMTKETNLLNVVYIIIDKNNLILERSH